jgi:acetyl esterase
LLTKEVEMPAPVDAEIATLFELLDAMSGGARLSESTPEQARAGMELMAAAAPRPDPPAEVEDRTLPGPGGPVPVRLYRPRRSEAPLPLVVFFHGGGFVLGSIATHDALCHRLCTGLDALVLSVGYRLAPEHPYPAGLEDAWAATVWAGAHAEELGADPSQLVLAGDSAGANLAAVCARRARDHGGPEIALQVLAYPATDLTGSQPSIRENAEAPGLRLDDLEWFGRLYLTDPALATDPDASPLFAPDVSGLAPAIIYTAGHDPLCDDGQRYAERLAEAGVRVRYRCFETLVHGFLSLDGVAKAATAAMEDLLSDVRDALPRPPGRETQGGRAS